MLRRRFVRDLTGGCTLRLPKGERALLSRLSDELTAAFESLQGSSGESTAPAEVPESMRRLFPPAYSTDEGAEGRFRDVTRAELMEHHREAFALLSASASESHLSDEQLVGWLAALTDLRLVLGTVLGVTDQEAGGGVPRTGQGIVYGYLSALQEELVDYLSGSLPEPVPGADDLVPEDPWGEPLGDLRWDGSQRPEDGEP